MPLDEPVWSVPPEPLEPSFSPTLTFTVVTVPSKVAVSVAPASASCALVSASCALCTRVWSTAICVLDAPDDWSSSSVACASARSDAASSTSDCRLAESKVASTWPAVTLSPALTLTAVTVPEAPKLRSSVWAAATVPSAEIVSPADRE